MENKAKHALNDSSVADSKINEPTHKSLEWHSLLIRSPRRSDTHGRNLYKSVFQISINEGSSQMTLSCFILIIFSLFSTESKNRVLSTAEGQRSAVCAA